MIGIADSVLLLLSMLKPTTKTKVGEYYISYFRFNCEVNAKRFKFFFITRKTL